MEMSDADIARLASKILSMKKEEPAKKVVAAPGKVTVILPVYNAMWFLPMVLHRLHPGHQMIPLIMFIACTEPDTDNTMAWLEAAAKSPKKWPASSFKEFRYFGGFPDHKNRESNLGHMYHAMLGKVETQYVWFQDADVLAPQGIIPAAIEMMEQDSELGFVGTLYSNETDHVRMGGSLMRADVARDINWKSKGDCVCRWLCEDELPRRNLKSEHIRDKLDAELRIARHLSQEE